MKLAKLDGDTVVEVLDIKTLFPNTSFPSSGPDNTWLLNNSCAKVGSLSYNSATQTIQNSDPYLLDGVVYTRRVTDLTSAELATASAIRNREKRDALIAATDWWALGDRSITDAQTAYRLALRNVPAQAGFPSSITWPTAP